jgi:hypothetical protein
MTYEDYIENAATKCFLQKDVTNYIDAMNLLDRLANLVQKTKVAKAGGKRFIEIRQNIQDAAQRFIDKQRD